MFVVFLWVPGGLTPKVLGEGAGVRLDVRDDSSRVADIGKGKAVVADRSGWAAGLQNVHDERGREVNALVDVVLDVRHSLHKPTLCEAKFTQVMPIFFLA
jgi:hypothetical protein